MSDRRDPSNQARLIGGDRQDDPPLDDGWLTSRDCADRLGVSPAFVIGEIREGRLHALVLERPPARTIYRIRESALRAYIARYRWAGAASHC